MKQAAKATQKSRIKAAGQGFINVPMIAARLATKGSQGQSVKSPLLTDSEQDSIQE